MGKTEDDQSLSRSERRSLRRIYNGRSVPIIADGRPFLTYKDASHYLQSLAPQARDVVYAEMKAQSKQAFLDMPPTTRADGLPDGR
jgi:hypothetical protein